MSPVPSLVKYIKKSFGVAPESAICASASDVIVARIVTNRISPHRGRMHPVFMRVLRLMRLGHTGTKRDGDGDAMGLGSMGLGHQGTEMGMQWGWGT